MSAEPVWQGAGYYEWEQWEYTHGSNCDSGATFILGPRCFIFNSEPTCNVYGGGYPDALQVLILKCPGGCNGNVCA